MSQGVQRDPRLSHALANRCASVATTITLTVTSCGSSSGRTARCTMPCGPRPASWSDEPSSWLAVYRRAQTRRKRKAQEAGGAQDDTRVLDGDRCSAGAGHQPRPFCTRAPPAAALRAGRGDFRTSVSASGGRSVGSIDSARLNTLTHAGSVSFTRYRAPGPDVRHHRRHRGPATQHLERDDREAPDVPCLRGWLAAALLRRHARAFRREFCRRSLVAH